MHLGLSYSHHDTHLKREEVAIAAVDLKPLRVVPSDVNHKYLYEKNTGNSSQENSSTTDPF